jgi:hypothetical protein
MLRIDNRRLEEQIKEILQRTVYASPQEYLMARVAADHKALLMGRKLP